MLDQRVVLSLAELLTVPADAVVVEDSGSLTASRGLAALVDQRYALQTQRERTVKQHGAPFEIGSAVALPTRADDGPRVIVWAITFALGASAAARVRATPLDVAAATDAALREAAGHEARHVAMPALGTRIDHHVLPPTPKKLPRYVMAAAQLIGVQQALDDVPSITQVTICLSQRDYGIFEDVLGRGRSGVGGSDDDD